MGQSRLISRAPYGSQCSWDLPRTPTRLTRVAAVCIPLLCPRSRGGVADCDCAELRSAHEARAELSIRANSAERDLARVKESEAKLSASLEESRAAAAHLQEAIDAEANGTSALREERDAL